MLNRRAFYTFITISIGVAMFVLFIGLTLIWIEQNELFELITMQKSDVSFVWSFDILLKTILGLDATDTFHNTIGILPRFTNSSYVEQYSNNDNTPSLTTYLSKDIPTINYRTKLPAVFVYHSHSQESWLPHPFHPQNNITLLGKVFAGRLEKIGIPTYFSDKDHDEILEQKKLSRASAYTISADTVAEAMGKNEEIEYIFDLHRDAVNRDYTTAIINEEAYAKIMFVIGKKNKNWRENYAFAEMLQNILEERYPGLCRPIAVYDHDRSHNGEYNQTFSNRALTVEIGGVENTYEEAQKTVEILADAFAEIYLEATPVIASSREGMK